MTHTNRLISETSPYLLQHAHNPVNWHPWGPEALQKAKEMDLPVLVSIGYAACHWCHVMERESFEDADTAAYMNSHFINIKIDREERPDLDHLYMDAVQAMTGSGGWPLNVFLTSDRKPFYGGTYFPPRAMHNRPSWMDVLKGIADAYTAKRSELESQADGLLEHIRASNTFGIQAGANTGFGYPFLLSNNTFNRAAEQCLKQADKQRGGFGSPPKFPQTFTIRFLLHYAHFTKNKEAREQACLSLDKMIYGGIYDQIGGGFARYATDRDWLVPHFEKMLYDNALLVSAIAEAFQVTGNGEYKRILEETISFVLRELHHEGGGFFAALDADSEGVEGKFYTWRKEEIDPLLGRDADIFCRYFGVTGKGNWEGHSILATETAPAVFAKQNGIDEIELMELLERCKKILLSARANRIRPQTDDKILLGWNALMIGALCKAYCASGNDEYKKGAVAEMEFLQQKFRGEGLYNYYHAYKNGNRKFPAFLDDYAYLADALIQLQEITGNGEYLNSAKEITEFLDAHFGDEDRIFYYYSHAEQDDILVRKKELYDGAVPSGNSVMFGNLLYLGTVFDREDWKTRSRLMASKMETLISRYPVSFGFWATQMQLAAYDLQEIVFTGTDIEDLKKEFLRKFIPNRILQSATVVNNTFPLLLNKPVSNTPLMFLCKNYACQQPVTELDEFVRLLGIV
jgi:uncharacterized protein YyaL (SSP411 family)